MKFLPLRRLLTWLTGPKSPAADDERFERAPVGSPAHAEAIATSHDPRPRFSLAARDLPAPSGAIAFRPYLPGDERSIMDGFNETFGLQRTGEYWNWKHRRSGERSVIVVAVDEAGRVQSQFSAMPLNWRFDDRTIRVGFVGDNYCRRHPALLRQRVFLRTIQFFHRQHRQSREFAFLYGFPNEVVRRLHNVVFPSLGPHPIPYFVRNLQPATESEPPGFALRLGPPNREAADELWARCQAAYPRGAARDGAWLQWRFQSRPDVSDYIFMHLTDRSGRVSAWTVLRKQGDTMWVCDLVWDRKDATALLALDAGIARQSRASGALANAMWLQGDATGETALISRGWTRTPNPHRENICFVVYDHGTDFAELLRSVYLTLADSDHI